MLVNKQNLENLIREQRYDKVEELLMRGMYSHYEVQDIGYCAMCFEKLNENKTKCPNGCDLD